MTTLRVWAPKPARVELDVQGVRHQMRRGHDGWWETELAPSEEPLDYAYVLDGGPPRPDPRSAWQPHGVHGPSRLVDHSAFAWSDQQWRGLPLAGSVLYELHVGTFTAEGTFDAAVERLDHLVDLGVDAVELLPCNAFAGERGWGYDGVAWFAVQDSYGGPDGLKRFVDACHARGLGVVMDVVYNHLGPAGNYLPEFGPYLTDAHTTPWGPAVNLDQPGSDEVRAFILDNVAMWFRDYHVDGLRLDAVHAFVDTRATHLLEEMAIEVEALAAQLRKPLFLVAESDLNDARLIRAREAGGYGLDGQWADDVHHALHVTLTGETAGYYADFAGLDVLADVLRNVFFHRGRFSSFRDRTHGRPVPPEISGHRFVTYLQNHDQVGNRATGDRLSMSLSPARLKVAAALLLTSPFTPMLFMGEEWGAQTPWQFFTDHEGELGEAVRQGRRAEFASHGWATEDVPDPQAEETFLASKLDWAELDGERARELLDWYRALITLRRTWGEVLDARRDHLDVAWDDDAQWLTTRRHGVVVVANLAASRQAVPLPGPPVSVLLSSAPGFVFSDGCVELDADSVVILELAQERSDST